MLSEKIHKLISKLKKIKEKKYFPVLLVVIFSLLFIATRLPRLADDVINPDAVLWHSRSEQFVVGIKYGQFEKTYQHYHPGVTLMWIVGSSVEIFKQLSGITVYNSDTYQTFDLVAKSTLIFVQLALSILVIYFLSKLTGFYKSFLVISLFSFEPFFLGNSRILHLDVLSTLLVFLGLIFAFENLRDRKFSKSIITGLLLALSFLTKSICIGALFYVIFYYFFHLIEEKNNKKEILRMSIFILVSFIFFTFLFFPALWKDPMYYLFEMIFGEGERVGMREGHRQVFLGEKKMDGGLLFYPLVTLLKMSPFTIIGIISFIFFKIKSRVCFIKILKNIKQSFQGLGLYLVVFYLGYILFMTVASKKIDRYIIFMYPLFAYLSYSGFKMAWDYIKNKRLYSFILVLTFLLFVILPIFKIFPWYFTYTSPVFGSTTNANGIIGQKSFGVGVIELKNVILEKYRDSGEDEPKLGFYDTQPIRAIYPNSKIFDVRVYGPSSYDLLVLTMNEEMPEKVLKNNDYKFEKDHSIWINGLEYWRIYTKISLKETEDVKE